MGETVVILRGSGVDKNKHGDPTPGVPDEAEVGDCVVWPRTTAEDDFRRDQVTEGLVVTMPAGTDILATDLVRARGLKYRVDGEPAVFSNPFAVGTDLVEVNLTRSEG